MSTTPEIEKTSEYYKYIIQARKAPKAADDTRVALVAYQLGLSEQDLEPFYYVSRKGASKRHFHYGKFAEKYGISVDWLHHGYLPAHPRHLKPVKKARRTNSEAMAQKREVRDAIRTRIRDVAATRDLSDEEIKPAMTTKHFELVQFAHKYAVNIEWLITGNGCIFKKDRAKRPQSRAMTGKEFAEVLIMLPEDEQRLMMAKLTELASKPEQPPPH
jgi:hypothetical protein